MKRFRRPGETKKFYRINDRIFASTLRVLDAEGKQIGVLGKIEALEKARELGLDLVEVAPKASPPVVRIINFNKFLYQEEKKKREEKRKSKGSETKEVRLGPFMDDHDLDVMMRRAREFLTENNKVKMVVKFTGRQMAHPEFGHQIMEKAIGILSDISKVEKERRFEGRNLISMLSPEKKGNKNNAEEENKEISI
ncbi:MAG: translation initiation factor IF-3 [Candidatus Levybacteria bacterium RIFOXYA1_FULL_41_10]|nr:MAG: translation initiation factor IF-3 [Candidatus Levybacteria bacterium RIFCSPHIGHO2_01_FULL_40_83]OGH27683.1 MAG: translation initiation factor IF-3 [Candidatus Levybacteria bacterium RIFCSPHIGHO2_02_FULL_40_29]OGH32810.1 MAG: translation initiation factor IF-3 [Candidatus Levybacteria bacterium RIFCSPHIGHO2_12_FULL_40_44]OGH41916.1 MAG: translation initiation factor IF-3 [Candidatus Levybacteria bacterium RIFCSPLOWO2_01_FULL_40_96]OGH50054.1 MAG: translation initiation factor IF-3 [Cand